jgi:hypothetical protein
MNPPSTRVQISFGFQFLPAMPLPYLSVLSALVHRFSLSRSPPPPHPRTHEPDVLQTTRSSTVDAQEQAGACGGGAGLSENTVRYCHPGTGVTTVPPSEGRKFPEVKYNHVMCTSIARVRIPTEIPKFGVRPPRVHVSAEGGGGAGMTDE